MKNNFKATYDPNTKEYKEKVLVPYWVYTGEIARKHGGKVDVRIVKEARFVDKSVSKPLGQVFVDESGRELLTETQEGTVRQTQYVVEPIDKPLQTEMPTRSGYFNDFKSVVPVDSELTRNKGKGYWYGTYFDNNGFSAVGSDWPSDAGVLGVLSSRPSNRYSDGVLPIWTSENPKK